MKNFVTLAALVGANITLPTGPPSGIIENPNGCFVAADVVFLQDTTGSFMDDMPVVNAQIPDIIDQVNTAFPGTLFGISEFRDKPYFPMGEADDFCYKVRYGELTNKPLVLQWAYGILEPSGGGDTYEAHHEAGINVVMDKSLGWRPLFDGAYNVKTKEPVDTQKVLDAIAKWQKGNVEEAGAHVVVMVTDAEPHIPGDFSMCKPGTPGWTEEWVCPQNLPPHPGVLVDDDQSITCAGNDYASEEQFVKVAMDNNVIFLFLTTEDVAPYYRRLNEQVFKNPASFHQVITADSSNFSSALISALQSVSAISCSEVPTTTTSTMNPTDTTAAETTTERTVGTTVTETPVATTTASVTTVSETPIATTAGTPEATTVGVTTVSETPIATTAGTPEATTVGATTVSETPIATTAGTPEATTVGATTVSETPIATTAGTPEATTAGATTVSETPIATTAGTPEATTAGVTTAATTPATTASTTAATTPATTAATTPATTAATTPATTAATTPATTAATTPATTAATTPATTAATTASTSESSTGNECEGNGCAPCVHGCDELVVKIGSPIKSMHLEYSN